MRALFSSNGPAAIHGNTRLGLSGHACCIYKYACMESIAISSVQHCL